MKKLLIVFLILAAVVLAGAFALRHFVTDHVMDWSGMENPNGADGPDDVHMLDGDATYVDNGALLAVIAGTWVSGDGRYVMTLEEDCRISLTLDGETVLDDQIQFTYLQPGDVRRTDFTLDSPVLRRGDETAAGEVGSFYHEVSGDDAAGRIVMEITGGDSGGGTVTFRKDTK